MTTLSEALVALDPANDAHWTKSGDPLLGHLKAATGADVTRDDVDKLTGGLRRSDTWAADLSAAMDLPEGSAGAEFAPPQNPFVAPPAPDTPAEPTAPPVGEYPDKPGVRPAPKLPRRSSLDARRYEADGAARGVSAGQVVKLIDHGVVQPATVLETFDNGEIDVDREGQIFTGVQHKSVVMQLPADDPLRNLPMWEF